MNTPQPFSDRGNPAPADPVHEKHYVPGHTKRKIFMIAVGLMFLIYGLSELWSPLSLMIKGAHATGEVVRVIKTKPGLPDQVFSDDLRLNAAEEKKDRSYIFWNEFHFATPDGVDHVVRLKIGSQLKPLFPLLDDDGLPTTAQIYYDDKDPRRICIPVVLSTWFAPGLITISGLFCTAFGGLLLYWSRHRIELIHS